MRRFWLLFSQCVTVCLAILFIITTLKPEWLNRGNALSGRAPVTIIQAAPNTALPASGSVANAPMGGTNTGSYRQAVAQAMPAVVNIFTTKAAPKRNPHSEDPLFRYFFGDQFGQAQPTSSLGSGVIVSTDGYVLTNNHVVEGADEIQVAFADGRKLLAKTVGTDPETDLAVLKIDAQNLHAITFGIAEQIQVGDVVLAIGNPFGVGQTVTMGIVSALGRNHLGINTFENFIQTDAAINPGNSGGALIDTSGHLLGINSAIYSKSGGSLGIGFAIPVSTAKQVMESIIQNGQVLRGWIGVEPQDITPELAESFGLPRNSGAIVAGVLQGGPADKGGLRPGDIFVSINDQPVNDTTSMLNQIAQLTPGSGAKMRMLRKDREVALYVTVGKRPKQQPAATGE